MDHAEVGELLLAIAAYDPYQRQEVNRARVQAWALALEHSGREISFETAQRAVVKFHIEVVGRPMAVADLISFAAQIDQERAAEARRERQRELAARHVLPEGERPQPTGVRDRSGEVRELLAGLMSRYRNWDVVGDPKTRTSQAAWNPALAEKVSEARHANAMRIARERSAERARRRAEGLPEIEA